MDRSNTVVAEGVGAFPENEQIIKQHKAPKEYLTLEVENPFYHGPKREECLLVKYRREKTYHNHYLDIYMCLTHNKEACRCGMEWKYYLEGHYAKA